MRQRIKFSDERVCKSHLLDSCPHDILSGTVSIMLKHVHKVQYNKHCDESIRAAIDMCSNPAHLS